MAKSLADLLADRDFDEPAEMRAIKAFVKATFQADVEVLMRERDIIVITSSASLANSLRLKVHDLRAAANTDKRLVFRIR